MTSIRRFGFRTFNLLSVLALVSFAVIDLNVGMATPVFYDALFGDFNANHTPSFLFLIGFSFTCFFIIPALVAKVIFREKLSNLGMRMPQGKAKTVLLVILALAVLTPSIYLLSKLPDFKSYYSLKHPSLLRMSLMITLLPLYYFAEEFFFRGFLFLGLWHRIGWHSFWITEIIFTLSHLHKPVIEILLCIPASVIFNCLSVYTRSFYPALMVHSSIGIFCLLVVNFSRITLF